MTLPRRVLLKLSGEALCAPGGRGFDVDVARAVARRIVELAAGGVETGVVVGAGNVFRGEELSAGERPALPRDRADRMGMLGTVMNGVVLCELLRAEGARAALLTGLRVPEVADTFTAARAAELLASGHVVVMAGGTGHPYFTTDTAAALRALEIGAHRLLKATKVDGVFDRDPEVHADAVRFDAITFDECLRRELRIMDATAFALCRDNDLEVVVFDMRVAGAMAAAAAGEPVGTRVHNEDL